ncbi:MAG TPA: type IV pilus modification protein PilV [Arenimonas sp.]|nr:type IV pilus modification protein PilV [Arenimonas sp.]
MPRSQAGASLLEILIAVLILAIGLLGIAALQAVTLRNMQGSGDRSVAVIQAYAMFDMMRANRDDALDGSYDTAGLICDAPAGGGRIDIEKGMWIDQMQAAMGEGACGEVDCNGGLCTVRVVWDETRLGGNEDNAAEEEHDVLMRSTL